MLTQDDVARMPLDKRLDRLARTADTLVATVAGESDVILGRRPDVKNGFLDLRLRTPGSFWFVMSDDVGSAFDVDRWAESASTSATTRRSSVPFAVGGRNR
jgi:hypothetical protein